MNPLRSTTLLRSARPLFVSGSALGAGARTSFMQNSRHYTSEATTSKKSGFKPLATLTLLAIGGGAGYYYNASQNIKTKYVPPTEQKKTIDYQKIYNEIAEMLDENSDYDDGSYGPVILRLAWHASGTYDKETNTGGSNGATMRFEPESAHAANNGLVIARDLMEKIHQKYPEISYGDLWTLAGACAVQELGGPIIPWRPGRQDAEVATSCTPDGRLPDATKKQDHIRDIFYRMGFNDQEIVALVGAHALGRCHPERSGFEGPWQEAPTMFSNEYFKAITTRTWIKRKLPHGGWQWVDKNNPDVMMLPAELAMYNDKEFKKYFDLYAKDQDKFYEDFTAAFTKLLELGVPFKGDEKVYRFKIVNE
ncbi:MAG: heme peroxidase [Benjaminiella poitrasii]|nr:MAG: heme peroxidase [Benjaminiella poitrasii]